MVTVSPVLTIPTIRVRGIFATALTVLLRRQGYIIVDTSRVLQERLGLPYLPSPATVTVKSTEERPDNLLIFSYPREHGVEVASRLLKTLKYATFRESKYGNNTLVHAVVEARQGGGCRVVLPDGREASVRAPSPCAGMASGERTIKLLTVIHDPPKGRTGNPIVSGELRIVGLYSIVSYPGEGVSYSEHIRDTDKMTDLLLAASDIIDISKYHVHFRSNSRNAEIGIVKDEISKLLDELKSLLETPPPEEPGVARWGEYLALIGVPRPAKDMLDELRSEAYPTIRFHHTLKSFGREESRHVDCAESAAQVYGAPQPRSGTIIMGFLVDKHPKKTVVIDHLQPSGRSLRLGPFMVESVHVEEERVKLILTRTFKTRGVLDALGVEKEPGDIGRTYIDTDKWYVVHEYFKPDGRLLGVYVNINTPSEIGLGRVKYLDLHIDVVKRPGHQPEIVDSDKLDRVYEEGLITEDLYRRARDEAEKAARRLASEYP